MSTIKASFGGRIPFVNFDQGSAIPCGFVFKLSDKLRPTHVTGGFRQAVVFDHILDVQALDAYDLVFAYDLGREFLLVVSSPFGNLLMDTSHFETSFCTVLRTFLL